MPEGCVWVVFERNLPCFAPAFTLDCNDWQVEGDFLQWEYRVADGAGRTVMQASKQLFRWTDTYVLEVARAQDALLCLMIVLAIDAAKCSCRKRLTGVQGPKTRRPGAFASFRQGLKRRFRGTLPYGTRDGPAGP